MTYQDWKNVAETNEEKIKEKLKEAFKDAVDNKHLTYVVEMDKDGNVWNWYKSAGSNSFSQSSFEGDSIVIANFCFQYADAEITDDMLKEHMNQEEIIDAYKRIENSEFDNLYNYLAECKLDVIQEAETEYWDWFKEEYEIEESDNKFDNFIEQMDNCI